MLVYVLIFLATINLVGFTLLPYVVGKDGPLSCFMPLHVMHKYFSLIQISLLINVVLSKSPTDMNLYIALMITSLIAVSDLFFGWKLFITRMFGIHKDDENIYSMPCVDIGHDFRCFTNTNFTLERPFDDHVIKVDDSRIMVDLINFTISVMLINLFL